MEINIPTASPFFTGIPNQIMYCISTPNLQSWNASNMYNNNDQQKKSENSSIAQPVVNNQTPQNQPPTQYYYGNGNAAITQNIQAFNHNYPPANIQSASNETSKVNSGNFTDNHDQNKNQQQERENRFFNDEGRAFECAVCQKKFRQKGTLVQHERIHLDLKPFSCDFPSCGKRFRQKAILNQHTRIHSDASSQLVYRNLGNNSGTLWPQNVPYPDEIRNEKSQDVKDSLSQLTTHSVFGNSQNGDSPEDSKSGKNAMPLYVRCPICQQEFKQKSTLVQRGCIHIENRPYSCMVVNCGRRFRQQSHLQQHNRIHLQQKPYKCPYNECQKFFRQQTILNQHIRVHTGAKPYKCKNCFKEFRQQAILSQHEKSHMSSTLKCPLTNCKRSFVTENDLRKHIEQHMNPGKSKKQSTTKSNNDFKPDVTTFTHHQAYPPLYFNPTTTIHQPKN